MRVRLLQSTLAFVAVLWLLVATNGANAAANPALAYETVDPARIKLGDTATLRVTSLDGYLDDIRLPVVPGLSFELIGRVQGLEFVSGQASPAWYILIRVTPQRLGLYSIPGITPKSPSVSLEVAADDTPNPFTVQVQRPARLSPPPISKAPIPKGIQLKANGAAFAQLVIPTRAVYVGESVPVDVELGLRANAVTSLNGMPTLSGSANDITLNNLSSQPLRRNQIIDGSTFLVLTWHSALAVLKAGKFPLSIETPLSVRPDVRSDADRDFGNIFGWPFSQIPNKGAPPKDVTIASNPAELEVLPLPTQGRPRDFSGAVGDFQVSSDVSATHVAAGDPLTLRLRISGAGNFDRVDSTMLDHLDHWKTYPPKATFTASDVPGTKGTKVFEEPLIAALPGEQSIPGLEFSYFNPTTQRYERARTQPIKVTVTASLADNSLGGPAEVRPQSGAAKTRWVQGLRPDHAGSQTSVRELRPLYFQATYLAVPATLVLLLAGSWFALRAHPARALTKAAERTLAQLTAAARSGHSAHFLETARAVLAQTLADRWRLSPQQIDSAELRARLGKTGEDIECLFALADEAKYSDAASRGIDFERWLDLVRNQLIDGAA